MSYQCLSVPPPVPGCEYLYHVHVLYMIVTLQIEYFLKQLLLDLNIEPVDQSVEYGVKHCQEMAAILSRLLSDGKCRECFKTYPLLYVYT